MSDLTWYVIYKTTHVETDQFYVGRHQTNNLDDGYQGSGNWVRSFEDSSVLVTEVIEYCEDAEHLREREQHYIDLWFDDPLCMNESRDSVGGFDWDNPSFRDAQSIRMTEQWKDSEYRKLYSERIRQSLSRPHERAARSARSKEMMSDPARRQYMRECMTGRSYSASTIEAMSKAALQSWTQERRRSASKTQQQVWQDPELRAKQSQDKCISFWVVTFLETGAQLPIQNLNAWAKQNGYSQGCLSEVAAGTRKSHKGLTCRKVTEEEYQQLVDQLNTQDNNPS